ncbi:MAG TPA: hypothetical protein VFM18_19195 [Methanosarcina sp.]|nr:hypothetical protein [Methanosarcina sp.]
MSTTKIIPDLYTIQSPATNFIGNVQVTGNLSVSNVLIDVGTVSTTGFLANGAYTQPFVDGIAVDYVTGNGRISVGTTDVITFYNSGIGNVQLAQLSSNGLSVVGNITSGNISTGAVTATGTVSTGVYTVATLPAGTIGKRATVTDANATTFLSNVFAGGANVVPVMHNGTTWIIG